jgi:hypothetical protein
MEPFVLLSESHGIRSVKIILVMGCARSGVNLAANQIARHPQCLLLDDLNLARSWLETIYAEKMSVNVDQLISKTNLAISKAHSKFPQITHESSILFEALVVPIVLNPSSDNMLTYIKRNIEFFNAKNVILIETRRDKVEVIHSLTRFPELYPFLPDPYEDFHNFQVEAISLLDESLNKISGLRQMNYDIHVLLFCDIIKRGLAYVWDLAGLGKESNLELNSLKGITSSLSFRERSLDTASVRSTEVAQDLSIKASLLATKNGSPVIATGRGGSGTRILTLLLQQFEIYMGNSINQTGDSVAWADLVYQMSLSRLNNRPCLSQEGWDRKLIYRAYKLNNDFKHDLWAIKLPEIMLVLPYFHAAWPKGKFVHIVRHPIETCLRRTHMTSRPSNHIGNATLKAAYKLSCFSSRPEGVAEHIDNAVSWSFQLGEMQKFKQNLDNVKDSLLEIRYEELCSDPQYCADRLAGFLNLDPVHVDIPVDQSRRLDWDLSDSRVHEIWEICRPIAELYGYKIQ